jgi:ribosomal protein S20
MKKLFAAVAVAGLLVGGVATTAWAAGPGGSGGRAREGRVAVQTAASTIGVQPRDLRSQIKAGTTVAQVATQHGVDPTTVVNAIVTAGTQEIDQAVAQGKIDQTKGDQAKQKLPDFANRFVNQPHQQNGYGFRKDAVQAAAKSIGISTDDLKQAVKGGKSIAQVAKDHDKAPDDVVNAIVNAVKSDIDQAVKDGTLDAQRADQIKSKLPDRVTKLVNHEHRQGQPTTPSTTAT